MKPILALYTLFLAMAWGVPFAEAPTDDLRPGLCVPAARLDQLEPLAAWLSGAGIDGMLLLDRQGGFVIVYWPISVASHACVVDAGPKALLATGRRR